MKNLPIRTLVRAAALLACAGPAAAQPVRMAELADLSLEQLASITVTSASRRVERLLDAPASIFVITAEDIRRAGASTLPDALRLAPNLQVVRRDTNQAIASARGGLTSTANKMLVLIDGRTVYTPLFSGVFWDAQDVMIEDVERIEVISGPGSTLWGTNAVNGVINITTRTAGGTQGVLAAASGGDHERGAAVRYGAPLGQAADWRTHAKYLKRTSRDLERGASANDASERWQVGGRGDWSSGGQSLTLQGEGYRANVDTLAVGGDTASGTRDLAGAHVLGRWRAQAARGGELFVQAYYDRTEREHRGSFKETRDTFDVEAHQALRHGSQALVWGGGYRASRDRTVDTPVLAFMPAGRTLRMANLYVQDEIEVTPALDATLGLRAEHNTYTGLEWLPNARLSYSVSPDHVVWSALTRTVRSPSRIDRDVVVPGQPPFVLLNNDSFDSEVATVFEAGYRARIMAGATFSVTAFHHRFRGLRVATPGEGGLVFANGADGRLTGVEAWGDVVVARDWRLVWGAAAMTQRTHLDVPGSLGEPPMGNNPKRTASLRSLWNVTRTHELDVAWRYVGALPNPPVPSYSVVDLRLGWRVRPDVELSLLLANAFDREYSEFGTPGQRAVFDRAFLLKVTWTP